ncbi:hypothetical protein PDIG_25410 [Penicillium digitatum PHI26]|uniref:feruloyl esterase n=2 Tax=Penicillium digitatum TaxID=36651 RepID=K9GLG3_PEND2|nr:hypothetical protein PDIP_59880 [Penicillium digitatum Pd1]EKV10516.1 hypothetical protein PDIP_59880 [Penicillium digitatum Pd1]EKV15548.1 hypothetical protein PDIG_25410 [Penicillium digitatum PHI26]
MESLSDLDFADDLLTHLQETLCVDTSNVYAASKSNGGGAASVIACNVTVRRQVAAFVAVRGD